MILRDLLNGVVIAANGRFTPKAISEAFRDPYEPGEELPWWTDNLGHLLCGAAIGGPVHILLGGVVAPTFVFLACAIVWEIFEYTYGVRPWDPEEDWPLDRAVEDTLLDTYVGLTGALLAAYGAIIFL